MVSELSTAPTSWKPQRSYRRRAGLSGSTLKLSASWRCSRADPTSASSKSEPMPRPRCVGTTPIDSSGVSASTKPYPRSCSGSRRSHAAPTGGPSWATTPRSPGRGHPDVVRQLWSCQDRLDVSERSVQPPAGRRDQHLSEETVVSRTSGTDADRHTGTLAHSLSPDRSTMVTRSAERSLADGDHGTDEPYR